VLPTSLRHSIPEIYIKASIANSVQEVRLQDGQQWSQGSLLGKGIQTGFGASTASSSVSWGSIFLG
jgi:hypothetical protein